MGQLLVRPDLFRTDPVAAGTIRETGLRREPLTTSADGVATVLLEPRSNADSAGILDQQSILNLQRMAGNQAVTELLDRYTTHERSRRPGLTVQRCGEHPCNGKCNATDALPIQQPVATTAISVQRAARIRDTRHLEAPLWSTNTRLDRAFHNDPTLTGSDGAADVALLQEALDTVFRPMPKSKTMAGGVAHFDGKWGDETFQAVREYQIAKHIHPPGGFEAGRRTLDALDADLRTAPTPPGPSPVPVPIPAPAQPKVCGPDVSGELTHVWSSVQSTFAGFSILEKFNNCRMLVQPLTVRGGSVGLNQDAFDTWGLFQNSAGWTRIPPWHGSCCQPGSRGNISDPTDPEHEASDVCSNTVQIGSDCWLTGTPNYGLFGIAMRLCSDFSDLAALGPLLGPLGMSLGAFHALFSLPSTMALVAAYKLVKGDNIVGPEKWASATWLGGPSATASGGNRAACSTTCPGPPPPTFFFVWEPNAPRSAMPTGSPYFP